MNLAGNTQNPFLTLEQARRMAHKHALNNGESSIHICAIIGRDIENDAYIVKGYKVDEWFDDSVVESWAFVHGEFVNHYQRG